MRNVNFLSGDNVPLSECVVLNTSSLSTFVRSNTFHLIRGCFGRILIPEGVSTEFSRHFRLPRGIIVRTLSSDQISRSRVLGLGKGENEAIILAYDMNAPLIMDDNGARTVAKQHDVHVLGSVTIIKIGFEKCYIDRVNYHQGIDNLVQSGRVNAKVISWARSARKPKERNSFIT